MRDAPFAIPVAIGALAAFVVLFATIWRARARREAVRRAERERRVRQLGWEYDPTRERDIRYRFRGASPKGVPWEMRYDSNRSSRNARPKLEWTAASLAVARMELAIGGRRLYDAFNRGAARTLLAGAARLFGRLAGGALDDLNSFVREAHTVPAGSARFRKRFVLVARETGLADLLDPETERLFLQWPKVDGKALETEQTLQVRLDRKGLHAQIQVDMPPMAVCEQLAHLGESLADRLRRARIG